MDNSKINQTELSYSCGAGEAKVNIFTGRLYYETKEVNLGLESFNISLSHIYNSHLSLPENERNFIGNKWKLNIQQYVYKENSKYYYIDGAGMKIEFVLLSNNVYYDSQGLGMKLTIYDKYVQITDMYENIMIFRDNKLVETVSTQNHSIIKKIVYTNGRITSLYDARKPDTKIVFNYNSEELLDEILAYTKNKEVFRLKYYYENGNLSYISKIVNGFEKKYLKFEYKNSLLQYSANIMNGSAFKFEYYLNKISKLSIGVVEFNISNELIDNYNIGDNIYLGDGKYVGEKIISEKFNVIDRMYDLGSDLLTYNEIIYNNNSTVVINERDIKMIYYLNQGGYLVSVLEANDVFNKDLRTLKKMPGYLMLNSNTSSNNNLEFINNQKSFLINTASNISTINNGLMSEKLENMDYYRGNVCPEYINYVCSFWLKLLDPVNNCNVKLSIVSKDNEAAEVGESSFDGSAINCWQEVRIPIKISYRAVKFAKLEFLENDENKNIQIADMRIYYSSTYKTMLTDGSKWGYLDDVSKIRYVPVTNPNEYRHISLDENTFITEKDLQMTYMAKFKLSGNTNTNDDFPLYYNDGTEHIIVKSAWLYIDDNNIFPIVFNNDSYSSYFDKNNTRAQYYTETLSPDGDVYIYVIPHFIKNYIMNGKTYDVMAVITEANRYIKTASSHKESFKLKCIDTKGKVILEQDEYGVQIIYNYDENGVLSEKKITNANDSSDYIVYNKSTTDEKVTSSDGIITEENYFDGEKITKIDYKGVDDSSSNKLVKEFGYDLFNGKVKKVSNNIGGHNFLYYDQAGRIIEMSPKEDSEYNKYSFKINYDKFGDPTKFFYSYGSSKTAVDNLLIEKIIDRYSGSVTTKFYRTEDDIDEVKTVVDKYGRIIEDTVQGNTVEYTRQNIEASYGAANVTKIEDKIEGKTYNFSYDDFNNLKSYGFVTEDQSELNIYKTSSTSTYIEENFSSDNIYNSLSIVDVALDDEKLMNGRIKKTNHQMYYGGQGDPIDYTYDSLGRIKQKTISIYEGFVSAPGTKITETKTFKNKTGQLIGKNVSLDNTIIKDTTMNFSFGYDQRGNIASKETYVKCKKDERNYKQVFEYNLANQLVKEINENTGIEYNYSYNNDGSLSSITTNGIVRNYNYDSTGRLATIREHETRLGLSYDNLGNVLSFGANNYTWTRGNLLESFTNNSLTTNYYYNGFGKKYKKILSDNTIITYNYDNEKLLSENWSNGKKLRFMYDLEGISGIYIENNGSGSLYYYVKDEQGSVVSILDNDVEIVHYEYDSFGNCYIAYSSNDIIANLNPIRWKGMYCETENNLYFINNNTYCPSLRQNLSMNVIEEVLSKSITINGLYPYQLNYKNYNSLYFEQFNVNTVLDLVYDPPEKSKWSRFWNEFWKSPLGKAVAVVITLIALVVSIWTGTFVGFLLTLGSVALTLIVGGVCAGIVAKKTGKGFWHGFANYINDNWAQTLAIEMAIFIISVAASKLFDFFTDCFIAGTLVLTSIGLIKIEDIKVGDLVWAYDEKTGKKALKQVKNLFRKKTNKWIHFKIKNLETNNIEEIICTPNHRIFTKNKGWVLANKLLEKDEVIMYNNNSGIIIEHELKKLSTEESTFNFEVEDFHTYFVGENSMLVHNDCVDNHLTPNGEEVYRGGSSLELKPGEVPIDSNGFVAMDAGPSVNVNMKKAARFGPPTKIQSIPDGLHLVQTSKDLGHYVIAASRPMTMNEYLFLLSKVKL